MFLLCCQMSHNAFIRVLISIGVDSHHKSHLSFLTENTKCYYVVKLQILLYIFYAYYTFALSIVKYIVKYVKYQSS